MPVSLGGKHVIVQAVAVLCLVFCSSSFPIEKVNCDPEDHVYYSSQLHECLSCDPCWSGTGIQPLEGADVGLGRNGATKCRTCPWCKKGTYNPDGDVYWKCIPCTVCATEYEVTQPCTRERDTECSTVPRVPKSTQLSKVDDSYQGDRKVDDSYQGDRKVDDSYQGDRKVEDGHHLSIAVIVVMSLVGFLIGGFAIYKGRHRMQNLICRRKQTASEIAEQQPLQVIKCEDRQEIGDEPASLYDEEHGEASDVLGSLHTSDNIRTPLIPRTKRKRHKSCSDSDYQSMSRLNPHSLETDGIREPTKTPKLQRQFSFPLTMKEVDNTRTHLETIEGKSIPSQAAVRYLSHLLAGKKRYQAFGRHFGLEPQTIEALEEDFQTRREKTELGVKDISYDLITMVFQRKPKLHNKDIDDALEKLGFHEELRRLRDKRHRCKI